jgi:hypothetical protein
MRSGEFAQSMRGRETGYAPANNCNTPMLLRR